jgi:hypothetical protein
MGGCPPLCPPSLVHHLISCICFSHALSPFTSVSLCTSFLCSVSILAVPIDNFQGTIWLTESPLLEKTPDTQK